MKLTKLHEAAFTLVELLVVIAIISLLSSIVLASLGQAREKAKIAKVKQELNSIRTAMYLFLSDHKELPPTDDNGTPQHNCNACVNSGDPYNYVCSDAIGSRGSLDYGWSTKILSGDHDGVMDELKPYLSSPINIDPWGHTFCYDDNYIDPGKCDQPTVLWSMGINGHSDTYQEPFNPNPPTGHPVGFLDDDIGIAIYDPSCN